MHLSSVYMTSPAHHFMMNIYTPWHQPIFIGEKVVLFSALLSLWDHQKYQKKINIVRYSHENVKDEKFKNVIVGDRKGGLPC